MSRTRLDDNGSMEVQWSDGEFTTFSLLWRENLKSGSDEMTEPRQEMFEVGDLTPDTRMKLTNIVNTMRLHRDVKYPLT